MLNTADLERVIAAEMATGDVPGAAVAVVLDQAIVYANGFGVTAAGEGGMAVTADTLFRIASCTKPMTGTLIMRLVQQGLVDLDVPIRNYVPELALQDDAVAGQITLRMLLAHTAGFRDGGTFVGRRDASGLAAFVREELPREQLFAAPGEIYCYSNRNSSLAGYVAERVTGQRFAALMEAELFRPLGMARSTLDPLQALTWPCALAHEKQADGKLTPKRHYLESVEDAPALGVISSVRDMARFALLHLQGGEVDGAPYLTPELLAEMHKPQADLHTAVPSASGLHVFLSYDHNLLQVRHFGGIDSFGSAWVSAPQQKIAVVVLHNRDMNVMKIIHHVFDALVPDAKRPEVQHNTNEADIAQYAGAYLGEKIGLADVQAEQGKLSMTLHGETYALQHVRDELYMARDEQGQEAASVGFVTGSTSYLMIDKTPLKRIERDAAFRLTSEELAAYAGTYSHGGYLKVTVTVEGESVLRFTGVLGDGVLQAVDGARFAGTDIPYVEFYQDETGQVNGVGVQGGWLFKREASAC
ncbi:CubicO group peptidase (beta-lactamase class C family) [Tumebacillus sp. BK434]|uniref:serine hydrolase n=1 Tax=Tumebacillus sp. BK434 TaxID=2512169 RepID=UPI00104E85C2|nr:serine hydrolase [Tumebacillus sp. BK434]TCP59194.1 CubicO group peptidase (beta-lactamase class C family) [Tumebacillus sp. BK434]